MICRYLFYFTFVMLFINTTGIGQNLYIPLGTSPLTDGLFHRSEWTGADSVVIPISSNKSTKVYFKHDNTKLYVAFAGNLQSGGNYFPEVLVDSQHDRATTFASDDWWFHVSATDCEYQGQYGNYSNCSVVRPNWTALPNFVFGGPAVDTVELEISFSTLGITTNDTIGLSFLLNNFTAVQAYPLSSIETNPSTWSSATFASLTSLNNELSPVEELNLSPNPSKGTVQLKLKMNRNASCFLKLFDAQGRLLLEKQLASNALWVEELINIENKLPGIYFVDLQIDNYRLSRRLVVQ